jgi:phospholipase/carboxylesterase
LGPLGSLARAVIDALAKRLRPAAAAPRGALVLLHGRGTDEYDLAPLIDVLDPKRELIGITPRGPLTLPPGGNHWYAVRRIGYPEPETFASTYALLEAWLGELSDELGVPPDRVVLGGFSQGAVMAYALALGAGRPSPAALVALSGFIPEVPGFAFDLEGRAGLPVAIAHGERDPVIPVSFGRDAERRLREAGLAVTYREAAGGHNVDPRLVVELAAWLQATLQPAA